MQRRSLIAAVAAAAALVLTGCSSDSGPTDPDPAAVLAQAKAKLDAAGTVHVVISSQGVPPDGVGISSGVGDGVISATEPKFKGQITGRIPGGISGTVDVVSIGPDAWVKILTSAYTKQDLDALGAPNPSVLFTPDKGISTMLTQTTGLTAGDRAREGKDIVRIYSGTVPGELVKSLLKIGDGAPVQVQWGVTESGELRSMRLTGTFFKTPGVVYTVKLSDFGKPVAIAKP